MPSATDIITYIGVPLAVLGVSPILYNFLIAWYVKVRTRRTLRANEIEAEIRSRFMNGIVEVDLLIYNLELRLSPGEAEARIGPTPKNLRRASWLPYSCNDHSENRAEPRRYWLSRIARGYITRQLQRSIALELPEASVDFEDLLLLLRMLGCHASAKGFKLLRERSLEDSLNTILLSAVPSPGLNSKGVICSATSQPRMELSVAKSSIENHGFLSLQFSSTISNPDLPLPDPVNRCNASRGRGSRVGAGGIADDEEVVMRLLELSADEYNQTNRIFIPKPEDDGSNSHDGREIAGNLPRVVEPIGGRVAHDKANRDGLYVWIGQAGIVRIYDTMADKQLDLSGLLNVYRYALNVAIVSKYLIPLFDFEPSSVFSGHLPSLVRFLEILSPVKIDFGIESGRRTARLKAKESDRTARSSLSQDDSSYVNRDMASLLDYINSLNYLDRSYAELAEYVLLIHNGLWKVLASQPHIELPIGSSKTNPPTAEAILYNMLTSSSIGDAIALYLEEFLIGIHRLSDLRYKHDRDGLSVCCAVIVLNEIHQVKDDFSLFVDMRACISSDLSYRGQLGEGTEGPRGRGQWGSSLEGADKGRLWRKGSRKGVD